MARKRFEELMITEAYKCPRCKTRFHLIYADWVRMAKQGLSIHCPRCLKVVVRGKELLSEYKEMPRKSKR